VPDYKALQRAAQNRQQEMNWGGDSGRRRRGQIQTLDRMDKIAKKKGKYTGYGDFSAINDSEWNNNRKKQPYTTVKKSVTKDVKSYMKKRKGVKAPSSYRP
jgi:hypothetical protein